MSNFKLSFWLLLVAFFLILVTLIVLRNNKINIKFAILWLIPSVALIILTIFPQIFVYFASLFGFVTISNLITGFILVLILFLIMALTIVMTDLNKKNIMLLQEVSMLKNKISKMEDNARSIDKWTFYIHMLF